MKKIIILATMLYLALPAIAQVPPAELNAGAKALVAATPKGVAIPSLRNVSSKLLRTQFALTSQSMQALQQAQVQQAMAILTDMTKPMEVRMGALEQFQNEIALMLTELQNKSTKEYAQWGTALLRERDPHFLPKKDRDIPGILAKSPQPVKYADISPKFFHEWAEELPDYENAEEVTVLITALRKQLFTLEVDMAAETARYLEAEAKLVPADDPKVAGNRVYRNDMKRAARLIYKYSKEAAQTVSDLVDLCAKYPEFYKENLMSLAAKLDAGLQTKFTTYLRAKIALPKIVDPSRSRVGFNAIQEPVVTGEEFAKPK